jgi:hypothetical protein
MNACYIDLKEREYLADVDDAERRSLWVSDKAAELLTKRETWEAGIEDARHDWADRPNPIIDALMKGDSAHAGYLLHKHVVGEFAESEADVLYELKPKWQEEDFDVG